MCMYGDNPCTNNNNNWWSRSTSCCESMRSIWKYCNATWCTWHTRTVSSPNAVTPYSCRFQEPWLAKPPSCMYNVSPVYGRFPFCDNIDMTILYIIHRVPSWWKHSPAVVQSHLTVLVYVGQVTLHKEIQPTKSICSMCKRPKNI